MSGLAKQRSQIPRAPIQEVDKAPLIADLARRRRIPYRVFLEDVSLKTSEEWTYVNFS